MELLTECSICLDDLNKKTIFTLSCNHKLHYECFLRCSYQKNYIFIDCPLCREMNTNATMPIKDPETHLRELLSHTKKKRCCSLTKSGRRCKKKASLLNYGLCSIHNKNILSKDKYDLMNRYLFYMIQATNRWYTKICMIDFVKKILIKYPEVKTIDEIHTFGLRYKCHRTKLLLDDKIIDRDGIYKYYELDDPPNDWIQKCVTERKIM